MLIDDEVALRDWLVVTLEPLCDAEPIALARYVLALVAKDKPLDRLRENCIDRLEVFLDRATKDFVDQLFDVICNRRYITDGKKENVQPKPSENNAELLELHEQQNVPSPTKETETDDIQQIESTTTSSAVPVKRRHSSRRSSNTNIDNHKRPSAGSPPAKRTQRSYSHSSTDSASPRNPDFSSNKIPCKDFFDNKGYCALGESCPYDHGSNVLTYEQQNYYPSYPHYNNPSAHFHQQYNPETPELKYDSHQIPSMYTRQPLPAGQRTLVTVVTNAEPLPLEQKLRHNDSSGPMSRTKRHITTAPYPNDRRMQQRDHQAKNNDGYNNRGRKRPWQKQDGSASGSATLEIRKIPVESNTISKLNEHFSRFGTVTNVQIAFDGSSDSALIAYASFQEAETAYKNPEPLFNNRFIKIFWHNPNKTQNSNPPSSDTSATKITTTTPPSNSVKPHWTKLQKTSPNKTEIQPKRKPTILPAPSIIKKEAAKKAAIEIRRKKQDLLEGQIQQQKLLLKKLETAETNEEKESIRSLMKQVDSTIVAVKDSFGTTAIKSATPTEKKLSQQDLLKKRAEMLKKQIESLRAKTSADMRRAMSTTLENKLPNPKNDEDEENRLLTDIEKTKNQPYELETHEEVQLLES